MAQSLSQHLHLPIRSASYIQPRLHAPLPPTPYVSTPSSTALISIDPQLSNNELGFLPYNCSFIIYNLVVLRFRTC